jgi:L-alanine-DL-glutamate epimerase-like enolase superfamily enzyme
MTKVAGYETWVVRIPYEEGRFGTHVVLRLRTDDGLSGIGYVSNLTPWSIKAQHAALEAMAERVIGEEPMRVESINTALLRTGTRPQFGGLARSVVSVIDAALWDIKARMLDRPLYRLLGASDNHVPVYASWNLWWQYDLKTLTDHAREHVDRGFKAMKYRMGGVTSTRDAIERTRVLREAVGPDVDLMVDMNWSWSTNFTIETGRALEEFGLFWIEDPIPADDYEGLRQVSEALGTRVIAGETYDTPKQFIEVLNRRALDDVIVDLEVGGITQFLKVAHLVESYGLKVASHTCTEIGTHLIAAVSNPLTVEYLPWAQPMFKSVPPVVDGKLVLGEEPGLGLELDEVALAIYAWG